MCSVVNRLREVCLVFLIVCGAFTANCQEGKTDTVTVYFDFNKDAISCFGKASQLQGFQFEKYSNRIHSISVLGFTDTVGTVEFNRNLAERRIASVNAVLLWLVPAHFIDKLVLKPLGEDISLNMSNEEKRRVEIVISYEVDRHDIAGADPGMKGNSKVVDTIIQLDKIYFKPDLPILAEGSFSALSGILLSLERFKLNVLEVRGHVNYTDSKLKEDDPLFILSTERAKVIYDYLIENGFYADRLKYIGLGNSQLVYVKPATESQRRVNMRVELVVYKRMIDL